MVALGAAESVKLGCDIAFVLGGSTAASAARVAAGVSIAEGVPHAAASSAPDNGALADPMDGCCTTADAMNAPSAAGVARAVLVAPPSAGWRASVSS